MTSHCDARGAAATAAPKVSSLSGAGFHTLSMKINELTCKTSFFFCIDQLLFAFLLFFFLGVIVVAVQTKRLEASKW